MNAQSETIWFARVNRELTAMVRRVKRRVSRTTVRDAASRAIWEKSVPMEPQKSALEAG
jgi:hypothetical protein